MYQIALTNEQTQLAFLVKQALQGEEVIITDENGFRFKLISLLPQKTHEEKPKTKLSECLLAPEIAIPDVIQPEKQAKSTENIFKKTAGILAHQKIDPLKWQRNMRNEWERE